jgi:acyl-CoA thioesterase
MIFKPGGFNMTDLERAREFFSHDKYATEATGIEIAEIGENYAKTVLKLDGRHMNARGTLMGAVIYTMADFTFAVSTNFDRDYGTVSTVSAVHHIAAAKGDVLTAESRLIKDGRTLCFYDIFITDNTGTLIAKVSITGTHIYPR